MYNLFLFASVIFTYVPTFVTSPLFIYFFYLFLLTSFLPSDILININRFNFLDKSVGISSLFEINSSTSVDRIPEFVETQEPLLVPGMEGLLIPCKTRGQVLKVVGGNTVLVRWEVSK